MEITRDEWINKASSILSQYISAGAEPDYNEWYFITTEAIALLNVIILPKEGEK